jgi:hypothetical protein
MPPRSGRPKGSWRGLKRAEISPATIARFHTKYVRTFDPGACWNWTAGKFPTGYGMVNLGRHADGRQHTEYAHRVAWVLETGDDIPGGSPLHLRHSCDNRACVNPAHLTLGTPQANHQDALDRERHSSIASRQAASGRAAEALTLLEVYPPQQVAQLMGISYGTVQRYRRTAGDTVKHWRPALPKAA